MIISIALIKSFYNSKNDYCIKQNTTYAMHNSRHTLVKLKKKALLAENS